MTEEQREMELFFDVETSGFPSKKLEPDDKKQAWAIQLAAVLSTKDTIIHELNVLIQPEGREMNYHAEKVHGISIEKAQAEGIPEAEAIAQFADLLLNEPTKVCHNYDFDSQFIDFMFKKHMDTLSDLQRSKFFIQLPAFCTMKSTAIRDYVGAVNVKGNIKWAKLTKMYKKLFEKEFDSAHDAMADVKALRDCYYELQKREVI